MQYSFNRRLIFSSVFLSMGMVLPLLTGQLKEIGDTLLPMHLPVLLCGLICGPYLGCIIGLLLPFLRSVIFGMPPLYPNGVWMAAELATYGLLIGLVYQMFKRKNLFAIYISLLSAMVAGRVVWALVKALLLHLADKPFGLEGMLAGGILDAVPGIVLQLILIPTVMQIIITVEKSHGH